MSLLSNRHVADLVALAMQSLSSVGFNAISHVKGRMLPEYEAATETVTIPTSIAPARAIIHRATGHDKCPPVHVNFHGGGYIMRTVQFDEPLCHFLAVEAGVVAVNVDYAVAPQHRFPAPPHQAFEVVRWVAENGSQSGWDGARLTVGGQSAGGALAAAVARQALERGGPPIALQVLHYPPLDLVTPERDKPSVIAKPVIRPWMGEVFDNAYIPDPHDRSDPLASPANPADDADLTGIASALIVTAEFDRLRAEGERYSQRLRKAGSLAAHHDVPHADHGYDMNDARRARQTYALIARFIKEATSG